MERCGHVFKCMGDQFCAAFATAPEAIAAALSAQRALCSEPWGEVGPVRVRIALHTGAAEQRDGDYFGPPLNRVARLLEAAHGGQVLVSLATEELVREAPLPGASLQDLGSHRLHDLAQPEHVFWEVLDLLTSLVEKSLVLYEEREGEGRYRLLETVRQYARDRLLEAGEAEAVRRRHRDGLLAERAACHHPAPAGTERIGQ